MILNDLLEMAAPTEELRSKKYYHGTSSEKAGLGILRDGIKPGDLVMPERHKPVKGPNLVPVAGKVYLSPTIMYAQMYALGGDIAGQVNEKGFGYLFIVDGKQLQDIQPDEDDVGQMAAEQLKDPKPDPTLKTLAVLAQAYLTKNQLYKLKDGEYSMYAHTGKKIMKYLSDADKIKLISLGANVAHTGAIQPESAWKIDKSRTTELKRDGSNFFDIAEKVS